MTTLGISHSEIEMWKRCPRKWLVQYYWGYLPANPPPTGAANLGTRVHMAMEGKYGYQLDPLMILDLIYAAEMEQHPAAATALAADLEMSKIMVSGYLEEAAAQGWDAGREVVATEAEVRVPLPGFTDVDLRAKLDQIYRDLENGLFGFLDWKTGADFKRAEVVRNDPQMRFYSLVQLLARGIVPAIGQPLTAPDGVPMVLGGTITTMRKVKRTRASKPPYYDRTEFRHTPEIMASTLLATQQAVREILDVRAALADAYERGGRLEEIDYIQRTLLRPVWLGHDCSWSCPLSSGACQLMDDGSRWADHFVTSGLYVQGDPYERYTRGSIAALAGAAG